MRYAQGEYGADPYGQSVEDSPRPVQPVDLMAYLPPFWGNSDEVRALQGALGTAVGQLWADFRELREQLVLETATWGLEFWESAFGVETDAGKSYAFRREQIRAKLRGSGTTTRQMVINLASAFSGGEAAVYEYPEESRFVVKFVGVKGVPPNLAGLERAIEEIKPAHLAFEFAYTYNYWDNLRATAWSALAAATWLQAKTR